MLKGLKMKLNSINFKGQYIKDAYYFIDKKDKGVIYGGTMPEKNLAQHPKIKKISEINPYYSVSLMGDCVYVNYKTYVADFNEEVCLNKLDKDTNYVARYAEPKQIPYPKIEWAASAKDFSGVDFSNLIEYEKAKCEHYNLKSTDKLEAYQLIQHYINKIKQIQEIKPKAQSYERALNSLEFMMKNDKTAPSKTQKSEQFLLDEFTREYFYLVVDSAYPDPNKAILFCLDEIGRIYESLNTDNNQQYAM